MISKLETISSRELNNQLSNIYKNTIHEIEDLAEQAPDQIVESVHLIRKRLKFLRAFVKLIQFCNEKQQYKPVNTILRDCGRTISDCRDAHVRGLLLNELSANLSISTLVKDLTDINDEITENIEQNLLSGTSVFDELVAKISGKKLKQYFKSLDADADCLASGYTLGYEKSYHAFHSELKSHEADLLHEWRKRTKDLQYQQEALIDSIPDQLSPFYEGVAALCEILGRINDIFMFLEWLDSLKKSVQTKKQLQVLRENLREELSELEDKADEMGHLLFSTSPEEYKQEILERIES
jgi:CHAD domain-containing protein